MWYAKVGCLAFRALDPNRPFWAKSIEVTFMTNTVVDGPKPCYCGAKTVIFVNLWLIPSEHFLNSHLEVFQPQVDSLVKKQF